VILLAVRWYLRYGLSYRDVGELLAERGIDVDHVTIYRWVQRFTPLVIDAARPCRHSVGDRWFIDDLLPEVLHDTSQFANNRIECDHGRLKARLRPMRGLRTDRTASVVISGTSSSRTCGAVTTNSESKPVTIVYASRQRSTN
jgi:transposase-like protein